MNNYGKRIFTGQWGGDKELAYIQQVTGRQPAIMGYDFLFYSGSWARPDGVTEKGIYYANNLKGIVTYCWHWFSPKGWTDQIWNSFYSDKTNFDVRLAVNSGSEENKLIIRDIDIIAQELKKLQSNNVPVIWRPLHEAEGTWFWWGKFGADPCKKLWRIVFDRLMNYHQLKNLIWVWTTANSNNAMSWFPGWDVVDVVVMDVYKNSGDYNSLALDFWKTYEIFSYKKLVALGENGPIPDLNAVVRDKAAWSWFGTWSDYFLT